MVNALRWEDTFMDQGGPMTPEQWGLRLQLRSEPLLAPLNCVFTYF